MKSVIEITGIVGILFCFGGFIYQYRARKHLKNNNTLLKLGIIKSLTRADIEEYNERGKEYLKRSDSCAVIGVSLVMVFLIFPEFSD